jgi:glutamate 5-kinase
MKNKKRIVVKIGTSLVAEGLKTGALLESLVADICAARGQGMDVILVSSGAIGAGMQVLKWQKRPTDIGKKQAAAAVGQVSLMKAYEKLFMSRGVCVAQVLLTRSDIEDRNRYLNVKNTLSALLELGVVPILNENDTVSVEEIKFGDNDRLSALVAAKMDADLLVILTDVDGLYNPLNKVVLPLVSRITKEIEEMASGKSRSGLGTGGMSSKIEAAKITAASGITTVIANGFKAGQLLEAMEGRAVGTKFMAGKLLSSKGKWILFGAIPKGEITVDDGAAHALRELKKSLLPAGVLDANGVFEKGDVVKIRDSAGREFARGIIGFSSEEIRKVQGLRSSEVQGVIGGPCADEVIHRDSLVVLP